MFLAMVLLPHVYKPLDLNFWPKSRYGKKIRCPNTFKLSNLQENKWEVGRILEVTLLTPSNIPPPIYARIYHLLSGLPKNHNQYEVTINDYSTCSCTDFLPWCLHPLTSGGYGCNVSTCITFYNMPCIVGLENHSSIIHPGVGMKFIDY
jgi:hypothetical protein